MPPALQICQPGFDVRSCPDWAYLFNSNWPNLAIAYEITIPKAGTTLPYTLTHNLGFVPLVIGWYRFGSTSYGRIPSSVFKVDAHTLTLQALKGDSLTIRMFNVDITKEIGYPLPQSANAKLPYNSNFGLKYAKDSRLVTSNNLNDFVIHTRAQSPAVLTVATEKGKYFTSSNPGSQLSGPYIVYPLQTPYLPWIIPAFKIATNPDTYQFTTVNGIQVINNKIVFPIPTAAGVVGGSLIVLRDPLFYPNVVQVTY